MILNKYESLVYLYNRLTKELIFINLRDLNYKNLENKENLNNEEIIEEILENLNNEFKYNK